MQEKVYQTHIVNIDELKHRLVQMWAELDHRHRCSLHDTAAYRKIRISVVYTSKWHTDEH